MLDVVFALMFKLSLINWGLLQCSTKYRFYTIKAASGEVGLDSVWLFSFVAMITNIYR